jgi:hypothetical protein
MNIGTAYLKFLEKVNKNYTNDNISVDVGRFVSLFNAKQIRYLEYVLEKRNEDDIRYVQKMLVKDRVLSFAGNVVNHYDFELPTDYFAFVNVQAKAGSGACTSKYINLWEVKNENIHELLQDEYNKPSFKWRETFYSFSSDRITIYVDSFSISEVYLSYYRYPRAVDMSGYIKENGDYSTDMDPEWDDKIVERIIEFCVADFDLNTENLQRYQFDNAKKISKF